MNALSHPYLLIGGAVVLILGWLLRGWASRHDFKDLAIDAAWQVAKKRGDLSTETELGNRWKELQAEPSQVGRAGKVAGYAARHFAAQVAGIAGWIALLAGIVLIAVAFFWG